MDSVLTCLVSDELGPGEILVRFLELAKDYFGFEYGVALRSPVMAVETALDALNLESGAGVIISALSPKFYDIILKARSFVPLYADVDAETAQLSLESVQALLPQNAKAIIMYHPLGCIPQMEPFMELGLPVIEDISEAVGAYEGTLKAGKTGTFTILGLEEDGIITSGGGALLFANSKRDGQILKNRAEKLVNEVLMTDMNAALAWTQLKEIEKFIEKRKELYGIFSRQILQSRHRLISMTVEGEPSYFSFPVLLKSGMKDVKSYAKKKDVETIGAFEGFLIDGEIIPETECRNARSFLLRCILFPLHPRLGKTQVQKVAKVLATLP